MITTLQDTIRNHWNAFAFSDYKGDDFTYSDVANIIFSEHSRYEKLGIRRGDKIAIYGPNSSRWAIAYLSVMTYGAVPVPILNDFTAEQAQNIINHSESRIVYTIKNKGSELMRSAMPNILDVVRIEKLAVVPEITVSINDVTFQPESSSEDVAMINYTSGTTGFSKGVMIPYRALDSNLEFAEKAFGKVLKANSCILSLLPMAHMYGMLVEFLYQFVKGTHVYFLTRLPSPSILVRAFAEINPRLVIAVPLLIEKLVKQKIKPDLEASGLLRARRWPIVGIFFSKLAHRRAKKFFGNNLYEVMTGGAALNSYTEDFLKLIHFPIAVGYGATECAPMISFSDWKSLKSGSCGRAVPNMEIRIDSPDPQHTVGEILARGTNTMIGYNKNELATREVLDADGWYHTGDLGVMDRAGNLYIKGRKKNMLLGPSGQNIYPEGLENTLNNMQLVIESIIVQRDNKLVALIYPAYEEAYDQNLNDKQILAQMKRNIAELNKHSASYEQISDVELMDKEFEKTPKKSIKRYLYS